MGSDTVYENEARDASYTADALKCPVRSGFFSGKQGGGWTKENAPGMCHRGNRSAAATRFVLIPPLAHEFSRLAIISLNIVNSHGPQRLRLRVKP